MTMPVPPQQGGPGGPVQLGMSDLALAAQRRLGGPAGVPAAGRGGVLPGGAPEGGPGGLPPQLIQLLMQLMGQ